MEYRKSQKAIGWHDEFVRYLDRIVQIDISHDAPAEQRGRCINLVTLRGIEENMQGMPLIQRPGQVHIPTKDRKRLKDKLDPKIREHLEWPSTNWEQYFAMERELPDLIFLFSVVINIVELTSVVFDLDRMATTQLAG